jgi:hypothetical protein
MEINTDITKTLVVSKEPIRCKLVVNDRPIEQVRRFNYFGVETRSEGDLKSEVFKQVNKAASISISTEASSMEKQEYEYKQ